MQTHPYFKILGKLTRNRVRYCIVGLMGASFYGSTFSTYDLDILIEAKKKTLLKVRRLLYEYGLSEVVVYRGEILKPPPREDEILEKKMVLHYLGLSGIAIDVMTRISGVNFDTVWKKRRKFSIQGQKINVASLRHILLSKLKSGRPKDLFHIKQLRELRRK